MIALLLGCVLSHHPEERVVAPPASSSSWESVIATPGVVSHAIEVSARTHSSLSGLLDLSDPRAAGIEDQTVPIVLPVHVLHHPEFGVFVVDTGIDRELAAGRPGAVRGIPRLALGQIEPVKPLGDILAAAPAALKGVLITHMHPDHIMGLMDVEPDVPVYVGAGEQQAKDVRFGLLRRSYRALFSGRAPLQVWDFSTAPVIDGIAAIDILGDGSLWALDAHGHTPGSTAYLAITTQGPMLMVGDTSHTVWGWENGVIPGKFTMDPEKNARSLGALRGLVERYPEIQVHVGHELERGDWGQP